MIQFDILGFLASRALHHSTEGKNIQQGWVGMACPFCNDPSTHLGYKIGSVGMNCWRCGPKNIFEYVSEVEGCSRQEAKKVINEFSSGGILNTQSEEIQRVAQIVLPRLESDLSDRAKNYLRGRKLAFKFLQEKYGVRQFPNSSIYKFRIYLPVTIKNRLVTFTSRAFVDTPKDSPKYLHLKKTSSILYAKETLYNIDNAGDTAIIVEGPFDVLRIGDGAVSTFGIMYTPKQLETIRRKFKRVFVLFDCDDRAQNQAEKLAHSIAAYGIDTHNIRLSHGDPADMKLDDVRALRREIFGLTR